MPPMTFGVEEEFLVVDAGTGELVPRSKELLPEARLVLGDEVSPELNLCQIEVGTPVCTELDELRVHLCRLRQDLSRAAGELGLRIAATGTHPFTSWREQEIDHSTRRYSRIEDTYQIVARQQVICGCHVHVGIDDPDLAIAVMGEIRPHLAVLLALSANSPFWHGLDTGYDSYRMQVWERWPTSGMPPLLSSRAEYDELVDRLREVEAIEDATFLYWYARPSVRYPTLEFRIADVGLHVDDAMAVAGLARALAWTAMRELEERGPSEPQPDEVLTAMVWRAGRYGVSDELVCPLDGELRPAADVVRTLLGHCRDGLEAHGDHDQVVGWVERILRHGNGAARQRRAFQRRGDGHDVIERIALESIPC